VELLDIDDRVREIIYEGTMTQLHRYLQEIKFVSFGMSAKQKVTAGITTVEEVLRVLPRTAFSRSRSLDKEPALVQAIE
jgi:type II secretory ATPase GspE/PulE/Tfp pilus assembly ATPase PilB-like protein